MSKIKPLCKTTNNEGTRTIFIVMQGLRCQRQFHYYFGCIAISFVLYKQHNMTKRHLKISLFHQFWVQYTKLPNLWRVSWWHFTTLSRLKRKPGIPVEMKIKTQFFEFSIQNLDVTITGIFYLKVKFPIKEPVCIRSWVGQEPSPNN